MKALRHKKMAEKHKKYHHTKALNCALPFCFFCTMNEPDPFLRTFKITECFKEIPLRDDPESVLALSGLWNIAMTRPDNPEFPELGIFECMAKLISRGISDRKWLFRDQNVYIPYYAAHIIGSYAMNRAEFAEIAVESGVIPPLMELLRGKISWVEQRVAIRALGHLASHERTFESVAQIGGETVELAMEIASNFVENVYTQFFCLKKRLKYQRNLLTRGLGGVEIENRKAEEWAIQTQCWSLYLINSFARKEKHLNFICKTNFLKNLCGIWGGLINPEAPGGIGLLRTLCKTETGRKAVADVEEVLKSLCVLARTSDEWQIMAIECLLNLIKDPETRYRVLETSVFSLVDLVELETGIDRKKQKLGDILTRALLQDYHKIKYGNQKLYSERATRALGELWDLKVEKKRKEKLMSEKEMKKRKLLVGILKKQGNHKFRIGEIEKAAMKYTEALNISLPKMRKQRLVLHSNRAQCFLLVRDPEAAISDTTRALCLSKQGSPHMRSLWRRSQAYDMMRLSKESLMDCLVFVSCRIKLKHKIPFYAARMINKQMNATWVFGSVKLRTLNSDEDLVRESVMGECGDGRMLMMKMKQRKNG
ncbi:uncharacterized protein LOC101214245 [Cucumis sativus]|uniref:Protein unc-45 homolog B n=1 Tax=Cucumis sativus TaxID=3659 RepID=A0A0A0KGF7_CUCSA|nr:uncharacterized protein LOC101214245 [Cucumis sativus]KGN48578.1 hypothetical protein Csa_004380 [Cucumis sativus]